MHSKELSISALLKRACVRFSQKELAEKLGVDVKTIGRWIREEARPSPLMIPGIKLAIFGDASGERAKPCDFTFIDLFAGIGGIRLGFEAAGGKCVFTSEWNDFSKKTYMANFNDDHEIAGDITQISVEDIPDHDVLVGGFPCQPFSIAGVSKKNSMGRLHGFADKTQGTLFFDVARIINAKRPKAFMLENVKNLLSHDKGQTFKVIKDTLENDLGYKVQFRVIDGQHFTPQHRERVIIVGFREDTAFDFKGLALPQNGPKLASILHPQNGTEKLADACVMGNKGKIDPKFTITDNLWAYLQAYAAKHKAAGNGFGFGLVNGASVTRTLSARYYKDGSEILIDQGKKKNPRRLTPRECARLMGYQDSYQIPVSDSQAYKQFGNSVVVPVMACVAKHMRPHIMKLVADEATAKGAKSKRVKKAPGKPRSLPLAT